MDSKMESSDQHYNHPNGDSTSDAPTETWGALLLQFTQDTTLHGIQYVFKPTRWFLRRFLWFLAVAAALAGFIYINYINVKLYSSYPKKVNVEVSVRNNLTFPSVTICNYNFHRFSKVVEMGLFDTFYVEYNPDADESIDDDTYMYDRCVQDEYGACASRDCLSAAPLYHDISSTACERLCSTVHSKRCNGFWYQRSLRKCYIWELVAMGRPINIYIELPPPVELTPLREELPGVRERPPLTSNYDVTPFISSSTGNDSTRRENRTKHDNDSNPGMSDLLPPPDPPVSSADNPDVGNVDNSNGSYPAEVTDSQSQAMPMRSHSPNHDGSSRSRPQRSQDVDYDSSSGDYDGSYYEDSYNDPSGDYYDWAYEGISISGDKYSSSSLHCDYEYYARRRPTRIPNLLCKFESGKCPGLNVESDYEPTREDHEMEEPFIITEARNPPEDFSTHSVRGSYLYLFETDKRQGFHAVATTDLFYGEDVCLEFYYTFIGEGITELHVTFVGVDNTALLTQTFSGNHESMKWQRFYTEVPSGDQRLELRARRPEGKISSGLAIDDVSLTKCSRLELQSKDGEICSRDRDGRSYMGPKSVTQNGIPCYNSTCGNQNNELKPWCYTSSDYEFDYCNITHCACEKMEFQCKDSKICLPKKFQCDGQRDCHDYTDEYEICEEKRGINCDFQTEFACGYMVGPLYTDLDVMLVSGINNTDELGPKTDRSGARLGSFINVDAQGGREGDRMSYWSPVFKHNTTNHCLTFWMYSVGDSASTVNSLRVYLVDADFIFGSQVHLKTFYLYHESFPKWKRMNVFVPLIVLYLTMQETIGGDNHKVAPSACTSVLSHTSHQCWMHSHGVTTPASRKLRTFEGFEQATSRTSHPSPDSLKDAIVEERTKMSKDFVKKNIKTCRAGPEYYRFIWEYTMGFPFQSSLAIDKVSIVPCFQNVPNDVNLHALNAKTSFNCHNFGPSCSINQRSSSAHGKWKWVPRHFLRNITDGNLQRGDCGHIRVTPEGYFETPLYPDPLLEEGTFCLVHVVMMPGSSVSLKFPSLTGSGKIQISTEPPQSSKIISQDIESYSNESVEFHGVAEVKVSLVYEGFGNATSFRGFYTVTKQDVQDYILAAEYSGSFSDVRHTIDMFTDVMLLNEAHCMSFISHAKTRDVQVFLGGRKHVAIKGKRTLLAKPWFPSLFNITLPPGKYNIFISLTLHRAEPGIYAAVDGINVKRGRCQDISTNGNVTCDFSAMGQCGYIDVSSSSTRWTRDIVDWPTVPPRSIDEAPAMVLRHKSKWRSEVFADLLTPRFEVTKDACLSFSFSAANATTISISLLESVDQLSALSSAYIGDVQVQSNKVQQTSIPIGRRHHYAIFSVRKQNSNFIMIDDVQLIESVCAPAVSASPGRKKRSSLYNNATDIASLNKVSATISQAPKFGESSFLSHLSTLLSPARQTPKSYGQFQRVIPRYHPGLPYEQITSEIGLATPPLRRDLSGLHSVDEVFRNTAPEMGTFIHSCQFNAQRCEFSKIQVTPTDFGTCYTFNPDGDSYTVTAGTRNGLQLVLNTESYENIKGDMTDAGVKVHVHDKDDIPYVRYVGSAAALSTHTYMAVTLVESLSLGEPYGSCASNHLDMYPDHNYTKFRCNQQCVTEAMVNKCQCRDHYMPGNATYCSLHEHLKCHVDLENLACDCPNACKVTAFSTQASFSSLSKDGVSNLLKDKQKFEAKFHKALNYHYRMEPKVTEKVISSMDQFSKAVETLMMFLKREATFGQTSVTFLTSSALHEIEKLTKRDIRKALSFLPNLITAFSCAEKFLQSRETELEIAQHKVHRFHDLVARLVVFNETSVAMDHHLLSSMSTDLKETFLILTIPFDYHPKCFSSNITDEQYIPLTLFADKTIEKSCKQSIERVKKQLSLTPVVDLEPRRAEKLTEYWNRIKLIISDIQSVDDLLSLNRNCTNSYSSLLHDISDWQMSLSQHYAKPNLKADFVFEKEILTVKQISERFKSDLFDGFKLNRTTMIEAANNIASERFHTFFGEIGRFKKKLEDTHLTFLRQEVNMGAPTRIKSLYKQALHHLANLRPYVPKSLGLTSSSRSMELWRKPKLDLDGSKLVAYHYEDGEIWRVWPRTVNVQNFYTFKSHRVLQLYVGDFFSELAEKLDELEINYQTLVDKTSNAFLFLNKSMSEILQSSVIDEQFILNNFLKLDVYYGELTHELIEQTPAYTISNFFSDMGGYLGLLLGASVLTIFELLDVIFYNSFQKCHERGKRGDSDKAYV